MTPAIKLHGFDPSFRSRFDTRPRTREEFSRAVDNLPSDVMIACGAVLYPFMNLTWGYVETIREQCIRMKLSETKPLTRQLKELKLDYDRFRQRDMGDLETAQETSAGEWVEDTLGDDFRRLFTSLEMEATRKYQDIDMRLLVVAVHQCLTLIETVKRYALKCDQRLRDTGFFAVPYSMVQDSFLKMEYVVKKFPGAKDPSFVSLRDTSARILENRLHGLKVLRENGKIMIAKAENIESKN